MTRPGIEVKVIIVGMALSAGAAGYSDRISAEGEDIPNECSGYDTKQSNGKVLVMLKLWGMWSIPLLSLFPVPLLSGGVAPDRVLSMSQIDVNCVITLNWIVWN